MADEEDFSDAVSALVQEAHDQAVQPTFTEYMTTNLDAFSRLITRQIGLLRRRSAKLQDNQITIYDKALLYLTRDGNDLVFPPAVRFFCAEYLGVDEYNLEDAEAVLEQHDILSNTPDQTLTIIGSQHESVVYPELKASTPRPFDTRDIDPAYTRLIEIYERARAEFLVVADRDDQTTVDAAKFVRDTVENVIDYLKDKNIDPDKHAELRTMARMAKDTVEKLCGGKKRKFDRGAVREPRRSSRRSPTRPDRVRYPTRDDYPYGRQEWRDDEGRRGRDRSPVCRPSFARQRTPERVRVPYGYSRPVDTYYPA